MDTFPTEIWVMILEYVSFKNRAVCSEWKELIDSIDKYKYHVYRIEIFENLPDDARKLSRLLQRFNWSLEERLKEYFEDPEVNGQRNHLTLIVGNDTIIMTLDVDVRVIDIEYLGNGALFIVCEEFLQQALLEKMELYRKLEFLLAQRFQDWDLYGKVRVFDNRISFRSKSTTYPLRFRRKLKVSDPDDIFEDDFRYVKGMIKRMMNWED